jgi:hypothetical protein
MVTIYAVALSHNINRLADLFSKIYCHVLACTKAIIPNRLLGFCHDIVNIQENSYTSFQSFHNNTIFELSIFDPSKVNIDPE